MTVTKDVVHFPTVTFLFIPIIYTVYSESIQTPSLFYAKII